MRVEIIFRNSFVIMHTPVPLHKKKKKDSRWSLPVPNFIWIQSYVGDKSNLPWKYPILGYSLPCNLSRVLANWIRDKSRFVLLLNFLSSITYQWSNSAVVVLPVHSKLNSFMRYKKASTKRHKIATRRFIHSFLYMNWNILNYYKIHRIYHTVLNFRKKIPHISTNLFIVRLFALRQQYSE